MINKDFLEILACPLCKSDLKVEGEALLCSNAACNLRFAVQDDIPNMLVDEAARPCPKCGANRDWKPEADMLSCKCGETFTWQRAGTRAR